jgi:hypothetical protein
MLIGGVRAGFLTVLVGQFLNPRLFFLLFLQRVLEHFYEQIEPCGRLSTKDVEKGHELVE